MDQHLHGATFSCILHGAKAKCVSAQVACRFTTAKWQFLNPSVLVFLDLFGSFSLAQILNQHTFFVAPVSLHLVSFKNPWVGRLAQFGRLQNGVKLYKLGRLHNGLHSSGVRSLGIRKMVCTLQRLINADFGRPQNGLHSWGVRRMVCTRWPSADWFALRDSMRTTSAPNLKRSCNENGCEKITKSAQIQSWQTNRVSQKWLSFLPLTNFDEFNFGVSSL